MVKNTQPDGAFGKAFAEARGKVPQRQLAEFIGVSEQAVSKWFSGGGVKLENFAAAVALVGADANVLLRAALDDAHAAGRLTDIHWPAQAYAWPPNDPSAHIAAEPMPPPSVTRDARGELVTLLYQLDPSAIQLLLQTARKFSRATSLPAFKKSG